MTDWPSHVVRISSRYRSTNVSRLAPRYGGAEKGQQAQVSRRDRLVDRDLGKPGACDLRSRAGQQHEQRTGHRESVWPKVAEKATHETGVVCLPERLLLVVAGGAFAHRWTGSDGAGGRAGYPLWRETVPIIVQWRKGRTKAKHTMVACTRGRKFGHQGGP